MVIIDSPLESHYWTHLEQTLAYQLLSKTVLDYRASSHVSFSGLYESRLVFFCFIFFVFSILSPRDEFEQKFLFSLRGYL